MMDIRHLRDEAGDGRDRPSEEAIAPIAAAQPAAAPEVDLEELMTLQVVLLCGVTRNDFPNDPYRASLFQTTLLRIMFHSKRQPAVASFVPSNRTISEGGGRVDF